MRSFPTAGAPHLPPTTSVRGVMLLVLIALVPGIAAHVFYFGSGILIQIALATLFALILEAMMLRWQGKPLAPFLGDCSAIVTAVLFALSIPPLCPWWVALLGMLAAIVVAKHLYGGLGQNIFNPAMVGYAVALICFPRELSQWLSPLSTHRMDLQQIATAIFQTGIAPVWDTISSATPLDTLRNLSARGMTIGEIRHNPLFGDYGGKAWEWIANGYALGGLFLLWRRVIHWQVPVACLGAVIALSLPYWLFDPDLHPFPLQHVFSGALVLGAFFIATDPVTGCATPRGRLLFGAGVGVLTLVIRRWGAYPDGVAFAVLLMNAAAPLIDRHTRPRVFGHR